MAVESNPGEAASPTAPTFVIQSVTNEAQWQAARSIRFEVFVDEQGFPAADELDAHDASARHWLLSDAGGAAIATARTLDLAGGGWKVGRVAVKRSHRGLGLGRQLMAAIISAAQQADLPELVLDSQVSAIPFYAKLDFVVVGDEFDEAGVPHRRMRRCLGTFAALPPGNL
ncbi:MAG: GNAT family N-acetyltransferase [Candidatus Sericytochromatia bacterium]|nr:GNAT family N-acetyltransferase [Candidatus Sericytochromatia bacterium]